MKKVKAPSPNPSQWEGNRIPPPLGEVRRGRFSHKTTMTKKDLIHADILKNAREMRRDPTEPEKRLWAKLRRKQLGGFKFRRQHPLGRFILDFYCDAAKLAVELDGASHAEQVTYDARRTQWIARQGIHVVRFGNQQVMREMDGVLTRLLLLCEERSGRKT